MGEAMPLQNSILRRKTVGDDPDKWGRYCRMDTLRRHRNLILIEGIVLVIFGWLALLLPGLFTFTFTIFLGWLLIILGIIQIFRSVTNRDAPGWGASFVSGLLFTGVGILLVANPIPGILTLTALLTMFFLIEGVLKTVVAWQLREETRQWVWFLVSGILSIIIAFVIMSGWPATALWTIGLLAGVYFIILGSSMIALAMEIPYLKNI
jgi:uncharacterized membrane protein HdeD (DUF308 family)